MRKISCFLRNKPLTVAAATVVVLGTLAGLLARTHAEERGDAEFQVSMSQTVPAYKQRVRIWIHGDGIRPQIVHAKPGLVNLLVENKTLLNAEMIVERLLPNQIVESVGTIAVSSERARRNHDLLLSEGEYLLYERSRPRFKAKLVVSP